MAKIKFADIKLPEKKDNVKVIQFAGADIEVKQTISIEDKYNLISITLQQAEENGVYNEVKLDMYFTLNILFKYSNIEFAAEDRLDYSELFDKLNESGLMAAVIKAIPTDEIQKMYECLNVQLERNLKYGNTVAAVIKKFIDDMPANAERAKEIIDGFDKEKFAEVIEFAQAANGGRPLPPTQN